MTNSKLHQILTIFIALVWFINGLICKVLGLVPRHQQIVEQVLNTDHSLVITRFIGVLEILMALWIVSQKFTKLNTIFQISLVIVMNLLEFYNAPNLLLWGKYNLFFAILFVGCIYYQTFVLKTQLAKHSE